MKMDCLRMGTRLVIFVVLLNLLNFSTANAQTNEISSSSNDKVQLKVWIDPEDDPIVSQQINLYIELARLHWLTGGTRIGAVEIDDAVVLRREKFAVNSTRIQNQQTWTVQLWTLTIYPQRAGKYVIPEIELEISVADKNGEPSKRLITTEPIMFSAVTPNQVLDELGSGGELSWVASTRLEVKESYDKASTELKIGDSVKRTIEFKSENVAAMMLPVLRFDSTPGLAIYQDPSKIEDKVNRGSYLASRTEVVTYVVEKAGYYTLPELEVFWWDLTSQSLARETFGERVISTKGATASAVVEEAVRELASKQAIDIDIRKIWVLLAAVFFASIGLWWLTKRFSLSVWGNGESGRLSKLEQQYIEHCRLGHYSYAGDLLYQWLYGQLETLDQAAIKLNCNDNSIRRWLGSMDAEHALKLFDNLMIVAHSQAHGQARDQNTDIEDLEMLPKEIKNILNTIKLPSTNDTSEFRLN